MPDTPQDADPGQENAAHEETNDTGEPDLAPRDSERSGEREVSPSVRRLLRQYDLDIDSIRGTGPGGRVRPSDVLAIVGNPQLMRHSSGTTADFADDPSRAPSDRRHAYSGQPPGPKLDRSLSRSSTATCPASSHIDSAQA